MQSNNLSNVLVLMTVGLLAIMMWAKMVDGWACLIKVASLTMKYMLSLLICNLNCIQWSLSFSQHLGKTDHCCINLFYIREIESWIRDTAHGRYILNTVNLSFLLCPPRNKNYSILTFCTLARDGVFNKLSVELIIIHHDNC